MARMFRPAFFLIGLLLLVVHGAHGADEYAEVSAFASKLKGIRWDLRGTFGLKHLRFDGKDVREVKSNGREGGVYESAFVDVGVLRLNFRGPNNGWYFFSDDLRFVTPLTADGEAFFALPPGAQAKAVRDFPKDITGVTFEAVPDERKLPQARLRWTGTQVEIHKQLPDKSWGVEILKPVIANRRVFEVETDGVPIWIAFSEDGKEAWTLKVENVFGGEAEGTSKPAAAGPAIAGLTPQQAELLAHVEHLQSAGEKVRADTLTRHLKRQLAKKPELAAAVERRLRK